MSVLRNDANKAAGEWGPLSSREVQRLVDAVPHWHHVISFPHGIRSPGAYDPRDLLERLALPDLTGMRVLDAGACDGFFSFACERLGASVVAIDHTDARSNGFATARRLLRSSVDCLTANVYDLKPTSFGTFDVVLFLGVLYHLRHPLLALDRLRALCRGTLYVESLTCDSGVFLDSMQSRPLVELAPELLDVPLAQFLPLGRFHPDWTNKWSPNVSCLRALVEEALFAVDDVQTWGDRALIRAHPRHDGNAVSRRDVDYGSAPCDQGHLLR